MLDLPRYTQGKDKSVPLQQKVKERTQSRNRTPGLVDTYFSKRTQSRG